MKAEPNLLKFTAEYARNISVVNSEYYTELFDALRKVRSVSLDGDFTLLIKKQLPGCVVNHLMSMGFGVSEVEEVNGLKVTIVKW